MTLLGQSVHDASRLAIEGSATAVSTGTVVVGGNLVGIVNAVKREIVETIRRVVDVVGRYAGYYLPSDSRQSVRSFILDLPSRLVPYINPGVGRWWPKKRRHGRSAESHETCE
jgi:Transcription factor Opi1